MKKILTLIVFVFFITAVSLATAFASEVKVINQPGERVDIEQYVVKGKLTIFDFYAEWCGPCQDIAPHLEKLVEQEGIAVYKINIKQWGSPVCQQHNIHSAPSFKIYGKDGTLQYDGDAAYEKVLEMINNLQ